jgi:hypothetical protein
MIPQYACVGRCRPILFLTAEQNLWILVRARSLQSTVTQSTNMKFSTSFSAWIFSFAALASAAPAPEALALPDSWEPITRDEILSRRATIESGLRKRTPGGVSHAFSTALVS